MLIFLTFQLISQARTQTFEKGVANLKNFTKWGVTLQQILILRPK